MTTYATRRTLRADLEALGLAAGDAVLVHAAGLTPEQLRAAWFEPVDDVAACARELLVRAGSSARMAVLPQGPQTILYLT